MSVSKIAIRYAKSFIDYGSENKKLPALMEDVNGILQLVKNKDFKLLLRSPIIKHEVKSQIITSLLGGKIQPETMNFLQLTLQKGRENILPEIMEAVVSKYQALQNITKVVVTSAVALSDQELEKITANLKKLKITGDNVAFVKKVDPSIIGGFILEIGDKLYDASVTSKLKVIKTELNQN